MSDRLQGLYVGFKENLSRTIADPNWDWQDPRALTKAVMKALECCCKQGVVCDTIAGWRVNTLDRSLCRYRASCRIGGSKIGGTGWLLDFCYSSHDLRQVSGEVRHDWKPDERFYLWLGAESELNPGVQDAARDFLKLCVIDCAIKLFVYPKSDRRITPEFFRKVIGRTCGTDPTNGGSVEWLFASVDKDKAERQKKLEMHAQVLVRNAQGFEVQSREW